MVEGNNPDTMVLIHGLWMTPRSWSTGFRTASEEDQSPLVPEKVSAPERAGRTRPGWVGLRASEIGGKTPDDRE